MLQPLCCPPPRACLAGSWASPALAPPLRSLPPTPSLSSTRPANPRCPGYRSSDECGYCKDDANSRASCPSLPHPIPCPHSSPALDVPLRLHSCTCRAPALQAILLPWLDIPPCPAHLPRPTTPTTVRLPAYSTYIHTIHTIHTTAAPSASTLCTCPGRISALASLYPSPPPCR